jgi:hypothetical protein
LWNLFLQKLRLLFEMHFCTIELLPLQYGSPPYLGQFKNNFQVGSYKSELQPQIHMIYDQEFSQNETPPPDECRPKPRQSSLQLLGRFVHNVFIWEFLIWFSLLGLTICPVLNIHDRLIANSQVSRNREVSQGKC